MISLERFKDSARIALAGTIFAGSLSLGCGFFESKQPIQTPTATSAAATPRPDIETKVPTQLEKKQELEDARRLMHQVLSPDYLARHQLFEKTRGDNRYFSGRDEWYQFVLANDRPYSFDFGSLVSIKTFIGYGKDQKPSASRVLVHLAIGDFADSRDQYKGANSTYREVDLPTKDQYLNDFPELSPFITFRGDQAQIRKDKQEEFVGAIYDVPERMNFKYDKQENLMGFVKLPNGQEVQIRVWENGADYIVKDPDVWQREDVTVLLKSYFRAHDFPMEYVFDLQKEITASVVSRQGQEVTWAVPNPYKKDSTIVVTNTYGDDYELLRSKIEGELDQDGENNPKKIGFKLFTISSMEYSMITEDKDAKIAKFTNKPFRYPGDAEHTLDISGGDNPKFSLTVTLPPAFESKN